MLPVILTVVLSGVSGLMLGASIRRWGLVASLALMLGAATVAVKNQLTFVTFLMALCALAGGYIIGRLIAKRKNLR